MLSKKIKIHAVIKPCSSLSFNKKFRRFLNYDVIQIHLILCIAAQFVWLCNVLSFLSFERERQSFSYLESAINIKFKYEHCRSKQPSKQKPSLSTSVLCVDGVFRDKVSELFMGKCDNP